MIVPWTVDLGEGIVYETLTAALGRYADQLREFAVEHGGVEELLRQADTAEALLEQIERAMDEG